MFKKIIAMIIAFAMVIVGLNYVPKNAEASVTSGSGSSSWSLVWNDEFNQTAGGAPDSSNWNYDTGASGWGNYELQNYTNSTNNVYIADMSSDSQSSDGKCLAIKAVREGNQITSGRIQSQNKLYARYGKIEAKLKVDKGSQSGVWPAFWMLGQNYNASGWNWNGADGNNPWPSCGEIDIMEHRNTESTVIGTLHWNPSTNAYNHVFAGSETTGQYGNIGSIEQWHRYSVEWYEDVMKWYVDDVCYQTMNITSSEMDEFQRGHFLLLNMAIGSTSSPFTLYQTVSDSFTDATMYVDYVRVYQGTDSNFQINKKTEGVTAAEQTTVSDGYTTCTTDAVTNVGKWNYYFGTWAGASGKYKGGSSLDDFSLKINSSQQSEWGIQASTQAMSVTAGHTYNYSVTMNSDKAGASVLLKDELGEKDLITKTLVSGDNVFSGTYTPTSDNMQFMLALGNLTEGTTVNFTNVTLTDTTTGEVTTTKTTEETTRASEETTIQSSDTDWTVIENSNNVFSYGNSNKISVVNVQQPGFASESGIYMTTDVAIGYVKIRGTKVGTDAVAIQDAGAVVYLSALTKATSNVEFYSASGNLLGSIDIKNANGTAGDETTIETTVQEITTAQEITTTKEAATTQETTTTIEPQQPGSSSLTAPTGVFAYNFYSQEKGYQFVFKEVEGAVSYNIYVDNSTSPAAQITASKDYVKASEFSDYADGKLHDIYLTAVDSDGNASVKSEAVQTRITIETNSSSNPNDISRIYVVTNSDNAITKADKTSASLTVIGGEEAVNTVNDGGTIKLRGNSTSLADKLAYNISFSSKKELFSGSEKSKKWCLLANAFDKSLMRSKLAMDLGNTLGNVASPNQHYADLYIDGVYKGNYLISEAAENGRAGIDYDDSDTSNEMMFEYERDKTEDGQTYYTTGLGMRFVAADPEGLDTSTDRYSKWVSTLSTFENALTNTSSDEVFNYIDVDSFVDMYIVNELFNTVDFGYSSVKFYIKNDEQGNPVIYGGPLWDFDLSSGNYSLEEARQYNRFRCQEVNLWFNYLMQNQTFKNKVIAKFKARQATIQNIYKENKLGSSQISQIQDYIYNSRVRNYKAVSEGGAGWSESVVDSAEIMYYPYSYGTIAPYNTYTYDQHVEYLTTWLQNRNEWMCTQWGIDYTTTEDEITVSDDIDITGYQMTSSLNSIEGNMGFRVVYQAEPEIEGQTATEVGLIYGLVYGDNPITTSDLIYGSNNEYVKSYVATDSGKLAEAIGDSKTASYYVRTMSCGADNGSDNITTSAYTSQYYVCAYAKLSDGSIVYSKPSSYTVYDIADYIYQNQIVSRKSTYDYLYTRILNFVNSSYEEGDFDWGTTIVK